MSYKIVSEDLKAEEILSKEKENNNTNGNGNKETDGDSESDNKDCNQKSDESDPTSSNINNKAPDANMTQSFDEDGKAGIQ